MASVASLREHLVEELNDLLNAEQQLVEALPMMAERATRKELQSAFRRHLAETKTHERRVTQALKALNEDASGTTCEAMKGLLEEGQELMSSGEPGALLDAMLITAAQKVEHYEIASYGTVRTYANVLGEKKVAQLLDQNLRDEKNADKKLTTIAEGAVNRQAAKEWHERQSAMSLLEKGAEWLGSTVGSVTKRVMPRGSGAGRQARSQAADRTHRGQGSRSNHERSRQRTRARKR
ncbi:MAG TPA: ferritin-like domain-containing protein [Vicinamibacterales bacterium]|nr:ferritin-like domain-containing protein [Vicinamibacterales bacterium]